MIDKLKMITEKYIEANKENPLILNMHIQYLYLKSNLFDLVYF